MAKALKFVQLGELSAGRQALEGAELAPGRTATLRALRNRPTTPLDAIPELRRDLTVFNLDEVLFGKNVRTGRKGTFRDDPRSSPPSVGKCQGFSLVAHSV